MCCLCCFNFSLMARSLCYPSAHVHIVCPFPQSWYETRVSCHWWLSVYALGLLFLANVKLLGGGLALGEGITGDVVSN